MEASHAAGVVVLCMETYQAAAAAPEVIAKAFNKCEEPPMTLLVVLDELLLVDSLLVNPCTNRRCRNIVRFASDILTNPTEKFLPPLAIPHQAP
mmetsp:Transcript_21370/g.31070  ORF Transcript_21370/g.31070 Transcript_21370/m.31070 type:complete len:94 (-) Transcript_21370:103-384(-)